MSPLGIWMALEPPVDSQMTAFQVQLGMGRSGQSRYLFMPDLGGFDFVALVVERLDHRIYRITKQSIKVANSLGLHGPTILSDGSVFIFTPRFSFVQLFVMILPRLLMSC